MANLQGIANVHNDENKDGEKIHVGENSTWSSKVPIT
jgi:hypothetical protein